MDSAVARPAGGFIAVDAELEREFEGLLAESSILAFRVAYGVLRQREDAEDVAQDVFIKAHRKFAQLRNRARFRAWLVRMAWRLALDRQRADRRRVARDGRVVAHGFPGPSQRAAREGGSPAEEAAARERSMQLWDAIDALPEKLRLVIVLAGIQEHDIGEVARLLDVPTGTVKSRLFLARQKLKEHLQWTR